MPDITSNPKRVCRGACGEQLPETEEFFYFRKPSGNTAGWWSGECRKCQATKATERERKLSRRRGIAIDDGLSGHVRDTQRKVRAAFAQMDPGGKRSNDLIRRLQSITKNFGNLGLELRAEALGKWIPEFLKPKS